MRSGELATRTGVSTDTLRHYERLRLLPKPPRSSGGYRRYPEQAVDRVRLIRGGLSLGFSLADLRDILEIRDRGEVPCCETLEIGRTKLRQINRQIEELLRMRTVLQGTLKEWERRLGRSVQGRPARLLEHLPQLTPLPRNAARSTRRRRP